MAGDQNKFQVAMTHAQKFVEQGNWTEAVKAYRFALTEFPNNQEAIIGFGMATFSAGQPELAQKAFQQALKLNPSNYEALNYMGQIQEQQGELHAAAESYLRAGNVCASQEDYGVAIESWSQVIRLVPDHADAHRQLARGLAWQEQPHLAARQLLTLAAIYQEREDYDQAVEQIRDAQELIGDDPGITAAFEALEQGQPIEPGKIGEGPPVEEATEENSLFLADFEDTYAQGDIFEEEDPFEIEAEPDDMPTEGLVETAQKEALAELANVIFEDVDKLELQAAISRDEINMLIIQGIDLQRQDSLLEAATNYRQVIEAGFTPPALLLNLGFLSRELGQYDEAIKMLRAAAQDDNYSTAAHFALGQTYHAVGDRQSALRHFLEAVKKIDLQTIDSHRVESLTQSYKRLLDDFLAQDDISKTNDFVTALENFFSHPTWKRRIYEARQRMDNVSENGDVMSLAEFLETPETEVVITALAVTGEFMKRNLLFTASEECLRAIQRAPSYLPLHARLAEILLKQEHTDAAIAKYLYIIKVYQMRNQVDRAIEIYHKILRLAPMDVTVRSKLIDIYISNGNIPEALDEYLTLANSYYQLAQVDRALEKYNEALRLTANTSDADSWKRQILSQMGDIYNQRFDWAKATSAFEQLLEISSGDERILRQLVDLYFKQRKTEEGFEALDKLLATYQQQSEPKKGLELLKELGSSYPGNVSLRQRLATAYIQNGMKEAAISEYDAIGEMQLESGLLDEATQTIQTILKLGPADPEGYRRLLAQISGGAV